MVDAVRADFLIKLNAARQELNTAGPIHRKDLTRHIRRMERELYDYDRFHREAGGEPHAKRNTPEQPCKPKERPSFQLS